MINSLKASLWTLVAMIFVMMVLGGATRLTGSGLSMVEWHPLTGFLPPLNETEWLAEFARYQTSPEFMKVHPHMTLPEFQSIFWLEFIHRLWGRLLGFVLLIPTMIVLFNRTYSHLRGRILMLWALGAGQGILGWYMVKSGLIDNPHVSPYRLAAHLLMGFAIFGVAISTALSVKRAPSTKGYSTQELHRILTRGRLGLALLVLTVTMGAFVAGLKAGLIYNSFPMMNGEWIPSEVLFHNPLWINFTENPATVQLTHRILATLTLAYLLWFAYTSYTNKVPPNVSAAAIALVGLVIGQYLLGILTLLYQVPVIMGTAHQGLALVLFGALVIMLKASKSPR